MIKKFRAFYKPDFDTSDGPIKFNMKIIDHELFFVAECDEEIRYSFEIPFVDDDWVIQQYIGMNDMDGVEVYEGDLVDYYFHDECGGVDIWKSCIVSFPDHDYRGFVILDYQKNILFNLLTADYKMIKVVGNIFQKTLDKAE